MIVVEALIGPVPGNQSLTYVLPEAAGHCELEEVLLICINAGMLTVLPQLSIASRDGGIRARVRSITGLSTGVSTAITWSHEMGTAIGLVGVPVQVLPMIRQLVSGDSISASLDGGAVTDEITSMRVTYIAHPDIEVSAVSR